MAKKWVADIFRAKQVAKGGVVRRKRASVQKLGLFEDLKAEVKRRRFHMVQIGDQLVILCNKGKMRVHI